MTKKQLFQVSSFGFIWLLASCGNKDNDFDASGVFEAKEIIVSAETAGQILEYDLEEGAELSAGQIVGMIDCENLNLQKAQIEASKEALSAKRNSAEPQVQIMNEQLIMQGKQLDTQNEQLLVLEKEQGRLEKLVKADAIPMKQLDDINGKVSVLKKQIEVSESQVNVLRQQISSQEQQIAISNRAIMSEQKPMDERIAQADNQIEKCQIINPISGTVLVKYAEKNEVTAPGKALYKLADLTELKLRAYITGSQLGQVKTNQKVTVLVDNGADEYKEMEGIIEWISAEAEFTPKTIQTKDERANLVYATKIRVINDGYLKIGMYGEVKF